MSDLERSVTAGELADSLRELLQLTWVGGEGGRGRTLRAAQGDDPTAGLLGNFECTPPTPPIQIIGPDQFDRIAISANTSHREAIERLKCSSPVMLILTEDQQPFTELVMLAEETSTPLLRSPFATETLRREIQAYLTLRLSSQEVKHGVFVEVHGIGILLTGQAGVGKSELALELVHRGHRLIADDAPEFTRTAPERIEGSCPALLQDFLEVRGLGFINMRALFGDSAIRLKKRLHLIVHLQPMDGQALQQLDRLNWNHRRERLLGVDVDQVTLPLAPGRELAILVETVARLFSQRSRGYDASAEFLERQRAIAAGSGS